MCVYGLERRQRKGRQVRRTIGAEGTRWIPRSTELTGGILENEAPRFGVRLRSIDERRETIARRVDSHRANEHAVGSPRINGGVVLGMRPQWCIATHVDRRPNANLCSTRAWQERADDEQEQPLLHSDASDHWKVLHRNRNG